MIKARKRFQKVFVEIGNICNLQCTFCPEVERPKARLNSDNLRKILLQVQPFAEEVCFHVMGEPLAHPQFSEFVFLAAELGVTIEITTNGTLLTQHKIDALLHPCVRQVNFSLQSFYDNFPGVDPETYLQKIFAFTHLALNARPELYINYRLWNLSEGVREDFQNQALLRRIEKEFQITIDRNADSRPRKGKLLLQRLYLHYDTRFEWPNSRDPLLREQGTCHGTRSHVAIHADGTVVPCCLDKEARIPLGNVFQQDFAELIRSERIEQMRLGFERGHLLEDLCRRCKYATRFSVNGAKNAKNRFAEA